MMFLYELYYDFVYLFPLIFLKRLKIYNSSANFVGLQFTIFEEIDHMSVKNPVNTHVSVNSCYWLSYLIFIYQSNKVI